MKPMTVANAVFFLARTYFFYLVETLSSSAERLLELKIIVESGPIQGPRLTHYCPTGTFRPQCQNFDSNFKKGSSKKKFL